MRTTDLQSEPFMVAFTTRSSVRGMTCILRLGLAAYSVVSVCSNVSLVITYKYKGQEPTQGFCGKFSRNKYLF